MSSYIWIKALTRVFQHGMHLHPGAMIGFNFPSNIAVDGDFRLAVEKGVIVLNKEAEAIFFAIFSTWPPHAFPSIFDVREAWNIARQN